VSMLGTDGTPALDPAHAARRVLARADQLATLTSMHDGIERVYLSPEHAAAHALAGDWMEQAGMTTWRDEAGNQCGRRTVDVPDTPALLLGSHLDSVPNAGRYDGILGVLIAIEVAERLAGADLPFALEVVAFGDEEGTRFGTTLLGSRALAGTWRDEWIDLRDEAGITLGEAAQDFGLDPQRMGRAARAPGSLIGYLEAHIEQGPKLEQQNRPLGVVTAIAAAERRLIRFVGETRHAATPWELRQDALLAAAEAIVAIERVAREQRSNATVGRIRVEPDAVNVVAGMAEISLDLRDVNEKERDQVWTLIRSALQTICLGRGIDFEVETMHRAAEAVCAPGLTGAIAAGVRAATGEERPMELVSIAGHDAMAVAELTGVAMLFVRCAGGISHSPDESVTTEDVAVAIDAMHATVLELAMRAAAGDPDAAA